MSDDRRLLEEMATAVLERSQARALVDEVLPLDLALWRVLEETGLARMSFAESQGGGDGNLQQLIAVLKLAGKFSAEVPIAESQLLAGWLLEQAGMDVPHGPLTCAIDSHLECVVVEGGWSLKGIARRVPWGSASSSFVAIANMPTEPSVVLVPSSAGEWVSSANIAGEPRDEVSLDVILGSSQVATIGAPETDELSLRASLGKAAMMAGAAERVFELVLEHVRNRSQFGRVIGSFQSVQHDVAKIASYCRAINVSTMSSTMTCDTLGFRSSESRVAVLATKAEANRLGTLIARSAHQLLGAIGFTDEHELRLSTTRLWSWCQECGTSATIQLELGSEALRRGKAWELISPQSDSVWSTQ